MSRYKLFVSLTILLVCASGCTSLEKTYTNLVLDNREHGLPCSSLPLVSEVNEVLTQQQDVVQQIIAVNPGHVFVDVDDTTCPGVADIVINLDGHDDRQQVEALIGGETFFGIPYRIYNR